MSLSLEEAIASRHSIRAFLDKPVDGALIRGVLTRASQSPSGGNLQPWHVTAVSGAPLVRLKALMHEKVTATPHGEGTEHDVYPKGLADPYEARRFGVGEAMYGKLGITREERKQRRLWFNHNYQFFGAPLGLFFHIHRNMGAAQWADLGMFLQSVMLLLRSEGLDSCPQACWALFHRTIDEFLQSPEELTLFCGMAVGYADLAHPVNQLRAARAGIEDFVKFIDR